MAKKGESAGSTALAVWDDELAKAAQEAADQEASTGGGKFFSTRGSILAFNGTPLPNNEVAAIVIDDVFENVYYEGEFDGENRQSPACYAFSRSDADLAPHDDAPSPQCGSCSECPNNKFGSALRGKGKACKNRRRLALIPAGQFSDDGSFEPFTDPDYYTTAPLGYLPLPVTSVLGFSAWKKQLNGTIKRPPYGVFVRVAIEPDPKTQFKVVFETLGPVPNELLASVIARNKAERELTIFPYQKVAEEAPVAKPAPRRAAAPAPAKAPAAKPAPVARVAAPARQPAPTRQAVPAKTTVPAAKGAPARASKF